MDDATVSPSAQLPSLDDRDLQLLSEVGRSWAGSAPPRDVWDRWLPVDRHLTFVDPSTSREGRFVRIRTRSTTGSADEVEATAQTAEGGRFSLRRIAFLTRRAVIGPALRSTAIAEEQIGRLLALAVLSPDALSSVAYGPEAMIAILLLAGSSQLTLSLPIGAALTVLMLAVGLGYREVIKAYPHGGGSYIIASDSLGSQWGLLAGAGLILDYTLTVAVSVASGVEAVTSAIPSLSSARVIIGLAVILLLVLGNLRGARDAGAAFALPTYMFVIAIALIVIVGLVHAGSHHFHPVPPAPHAAIEAVGILLVLRAFSSGATAMTGIEVISNAVPVFHQPQSRNARQTLTVMVALLVSMFVGVVLVAHFDGATPTSSETLLSEIARKSVGSGVLYGFVQLSTTLVLLLEANSAFNGLPRLLYFMARDSYVPRLFLRMGDRLAFSNGIVVLAVPAAIIFAAFGGRTQPLIPLFAIGVFIAFTLAQAGMVARWLRLKERGWRHGLAVNLLGASLSLAVVLIATITKFLQGAWLIVLLVPLIMLACRRVHAHYQRARSALTPTPQTQYRIRSSARVTHPQLAPQAQAPSDAKRASSDAQGSAVDLRRAAADLPRSVERQDSPSEIHGFAVVPIAVLDLAALKALAYAVSLRQPVLALHVSPAEEEAQRFQQAWRAWGEHLPLEVVISPFRAVVAPLAHYIEGLHKQRPDLTLTLVVPELVVARPWQRILHNRVAPRLRSSLIRYEGIVITTVPFHLPK